MRSGEREATRPTPVPPARRPRLGFLGLGWIGRNRLQAIQDSHVADVVALADPVAEELRAASSIAPAAATMPSLQALLEVSLDGLVIATPSALHAAQSMAALERGLAVFCQKPLARTAAEARAVVEAARAADRLLGVDLSYRATTAMQRLREQALAGAIGEIYAADLVFHNAYGPDKPWFYDRALSGGGCLMDLGIHLVDLALWMLGFPDVVHVHGRLMAGGKPLCEPTQVEDFATAELELSTGALVQLRCSWRLPAGRDAIIAASFYGTRGGLTMRNVNGSFYDFVAERHAGTSTEILTEPPDTWGGRAAVAWARALALGAGFDPAARELVTVSEVLDRIYSSAGAPHARAHD
jgi:predicted dehydrogenase